jgi:molybdate transport system substrate-binding protein
VFAAASLGDALARVAEAYAGRGNANPRLSFAASSTLAKQIDQGSEADIFISADEAWMDWLEKRGRLAVGTRRPLLANSLVLVVPSGRALSLEIGRGTGWIDKLPAGRIAVGDPDHVPAGRYARQALETLGAWEAARPRLARADNVRSALVLVERGEAVAGIVYATDARITTRVTVAGRFPSSSHAPIVYPVALIRSRERPAARRLYDFLSSPEARSILARHGFTPR